ncbi:hypothetical protein MPSEU_000101000 [Mayamaea pseudoterrestris]|nr:hypothetical protein MPSEU_000101000 [Mayamaea pseudoterrestris]
MANLESSTRCSYVTATMKEHGDESFRSDVKVSSSSRASQQSSLRQSPPLFKSQQQPSMMYRKNFGKTGIYVPPEGSGTFANGQSSRAHLKCTIADDDDDNAGEEDEFIQRKDLHVESSEEEADVHSESAKPLPVALAIPLSDNHRMMSMESRPFDERLGDEAVICPFQEDDIEPPSLSPASATTGRLSSTSPSTANSSKSLLSTDKSLSQRTRPIPAINPLSTPDRFDMPPPRISSPTTTLMAQLTLPTKTECQKAGVVVQDREQLEEDDSLFEFSDGPGRRAARLNHRASVQADRSSENTSIGRSSRVSRRMSDAQSTMLSHRTCEGRDSKQRQRQSALERLRDSSPTSIRNSSVSFDRQKDTIQYYEPDDDINDNTTLADRSLESEYTKSAESEVVDLIKDLFMIGGGVPTNPGRRKVKYSSTTKEKLIPSQSQTDDEDDTCATYDDSEFQETTSSRKKSSQSFKRRDLYTHDEKEEDGDPLTEVWNYMEGGIKTVGAVLGLTAEGTTPRFDKVHATSVCVHSDRNPDIDDGDDDDYDDNDDDIDVYEGAAQAFWQQILGKSRVCAGGGEFAAIEAADEPVLRTAVEDDVPHALSLEEDMRLVNLASQSARSVHRLKGIEFDESYEINIATDIHFVVVDLVMPFGIIFQENPTGVWVTKFMPGGSAFETKQVQIGDQLAAIDGLSAINLTVDEVSALVRRKPGLVELTFLRYIGPVRPVAAVDEEGYEVKPSIEAHRAAVSQTMPRSSSVCNIVPTAAVRGSSAIPVNGKQRLRLFKFGRHRK